MSWWMWTLIIVGALIIFLLFMLIITKLTITILLYHGNDNDHFKVKLRAWFGLIKYTIDIPLVKLDDDGPNVVLEEETKKGDESNPSKEKKSRKKITPKNFIDSLNDTKEVVIHVHSMHRIIRGFLKKVKVDQVHWKTLFGSGDAASTGTLTGMIWGMKGSIIGIVSGYMRLQSMPVIEVTPTFQHAVVQTQFSCIIQFRIGNAILVGFKILRYWRGGMAKFKTKPLSSLSGEKHSV
ncbi:DUF2953 domain-containing protein [Bacillus sp. KH172YL63]|uniref:DUF2953 domain-containing protein n=1 Tax=Bacillus sp. KH172YL63 TaxID=2709784 RepID=UPI0013E4CE5B|nr:DUF2953 domain-containing protein [Bacillus sp. KH172YL63]BCB05250.1 hypothetical protein KH172YL63_33830 [Bacillus sp. KH172YL63]